MQTYPTTLLSIPVSPNRIKKLNVCLKLSLWLSFALHKGNNYIDIALVPSEKIKVYFFFIYLYFCATKPTYLSTKRQ